MIFSRCERNKIDECSLNSMNKILHIFELSGTQNKTELNAYKIKLRN